MASARQKSDSNCDSLALKELATHPTLSDLLTLLFGRQAYPSQPPDHHIATDASPHSLANQYQSNPSGFLCGAFIALEDIDVDQKPLCLYPGSHLPSSFCFESSLSIQQQLELNSLSPRCIKATCGDVVLSTQNLFIFSLFRRLSAGVHGRLC